MKSAVEFIFQEHALEAVERDGAEGGRRGGLVAHRTGGVFVPVELHPEVLQGVRRFVVINNAG